MFTFAALEWLGVVLLFSGAFLMSLNIGKLSSIWSWPFLFLGAAVMLIFFWHTGQSGLIFGQAVGLTCSSLGFIAWKSNTDAVKEAASKAAIALCAMAAGTLLYSVYLTTMELNITALEWLGASFSAVGGFLMASHIKSSPYAWVYWLLANALLLVVSYFNEHYAFMLLNVFYSLINIVGVYRWTLPKARTDWQELKRFFATKASAIADTKEAA